MLMNMTLEGLKDSSMKVLNKDSRIVYVNKGQNPRALYEHQIEVQKKLNKINKRDEFSALLVLPTGERVIIVMGAVFIMKSRVSGTLTKYI